MRPTSLWFSVLAFAVIGCAASDPDPCAGPDFGLAADGDGDGVPDLVVPAFNSQTVSWHRGIGGGSFDAPELLASMVGPFDDVALADLDGDGRLDVVGTGFVDAACSWFPGTGGGTLGPARSVTAGVSSSLSKGRS